METNEKKGTILGLIALLLWSMTVGLVRSISEQMGPIAAGAAVYFIGGFLSILWFYWKKNTISLSKKSDRIYFTACGGLFVIYTLALFLALGLAVDRLQSVEIALLNYLWPAFGLIISIGLFKRQPRFWFIPAMLIALWGEFLVLTSTENSPGFAFLSQISENLTVYTCGFIAAISWGLYSNLTDIFDPNSNLQAVPWFMIVTGLLLSLISLAIVVEFQWTFKLATEIFILSTTTAIAYNLWETAMKTGDRDFILSSAYLLPILSTIFTCFYLQILPGPQLWIGCICIIAGSYAGYIAITGNNHPPTCHKEGI